MIKINNVFGRQHHSKSEKSICIIFGLLRRRGSASVRSADVRKFSVTVLILEKLPGLHFIISLKKNVAPL